VMILGANLVWATPPTTEKPASESAETKGVETLGVAEEVSEFVEIPETYRKAYFEKKPDGFLIDPQRLLGPVVGRDRAAFLKYHAGDSSIDLHVYLLGEKQRVPELSQREELVEKFFSEGKPSAVVWYSFGEPERTVLHLSPSLRDAVPEAEIKRALESSVMQAVEKSDPAGQFEAFLVQMSIRLYWMERIIGNEDATEGGAAEMAAAPRKKDEDPGVGLGERLKPVISLAREWALEAGVFLAVLVVLVIAMVWSRIRARHVLPDFSVEPRLGGEHGAGVGAVISFANASVPPASQRGREG
jgi:hypothetical protein